MTLSKILLSSSIIAFFFVVAWMLMGAQSVEAATKTWDNGGGDNSWNTATNWAPDGVPDTTDDVIFDTTSIADCTLDNVGPDTIGSITINSGYTGTLNIDSTKLAVTNEHFTVTGDFVVNSGANATLNFVNDTTDYRWFSVDNFTVNTGATFNVTSQTITAERSFFEVNGDFLIDTGVTSVMDFGLDVYVRGDYIQNSGTVTIGNSFGWKSIYMRTSDSSDQGRQMVINGGSLIVGKGNLYFYGADFIWNGGTVDMTHADAWIFDDSQNTSDTMTIDLVSELEVGNTGFWGNGTVTFAADTVLHCTDDCELDINDGAMNGPASSFVRLTDDLGIGVRLPHKGPGGTLLFKFTGTNNITLIPRPDNILRNPVEVETTGGTLTLRENGTYSSFTITSGTVVQSTSTNSDFDVKSGGSFVMNGGTFTGAANTRTFSVASGGALTLNAGSFTAPAATTFLVSSGGTMTVAGGTFSGGTGTTDIDGTFSLTSGTATLTSGNSNISGTFSTSGGTLNHGSGTVVFDGTGASIDVNSSETLNAITINLTGDTDTMTIASGDSLIAEGLITTTNGKLSGKIEAQGNVSAGAGFNGGPGPIYFANSAVQTIDDGGNLPGLEINKSGGSLTINDGPSGSGTDADVLLTQGDVILPTGGSFWTEGSFTMDGGTLTCQGDSYFDIDESVTINGGVWTGGSTYSGSYSGPFTQTGGTFNVGTDGYEADSITISGGIFNAGSGSTGVKSYSSFYHTGGTFNADTSTVILSTATAATITGDTTFYDLSCTVAGKSLEFGAGDTIAVTGLLTITGASGNEIVLRSTVSGTHWNLNSSGTFDVSFVDVKDSNASSGQKIMQLDSINSGNNLNWDFYNPHAEFTSPPTEVSLEIKTIEKTATSVKATVAVVGKDIKEFALSESQFFENSKWQNFEARDIAGDAVPTMFVDWSFSNPAAETFELFGIFKSDTQVVTNPVSTSFTQADIPFLTEPVEDIGEIVSGDYIKGETLPEVYYIDESGLGILVRHTVFDLLTFYTYQPTKIIIRRVADASIRMINFGKIQLYNPGVVLVSFNSTNQIYVIAENTNDRYRPLLFELTNDEYAIWALGDNWRDYIVEIDDTLFPRFIFGGPVKSKDQIEKSKMKTLRELEEAVNSGK